MVQATARMATGNSPAATDALAPAQAGAVSWGAIVAGAVGAAALSLLLLIVGTGFGLSSMSPWAGQAAVPASLGLATILWVSFTQLAAAGMGGYLAGRLRSRWIGTHADEVYFRDTAHGFLAWALATLLTAAFLTSAIGAIASEGAQIGAAAASGPIAGAAGAALSAAKGAPSGDEAGIAQRYFVDAMFRKDSGSSAETTATPNAAALSPPPGDQGAASKGEVARILASAMSSGTLSPDDSTYVARLVSQQTGMAQADAERRVAGVFARMRAQAQQWELAAHDAAEKTRKASAYSALWLSVSLLVGAFCASFAATVGGHRRDRF